ncbi:sensor domain-containing diguanylate cyclase [Alteromonas halophila]|nr:GGDEF domain-containing protein [Alteromonas halophila]
MSKYKMMTRWLTAGLVCISLFKGVVFADESTLNAWPPSAQRFLKDIRDEPQDVINAVQAELLQEQRTTYRAAYYAILSRAYSALVLPHKGLDRADKGLALVTESLHPWLYHNLAVAKAEALDNSGKPGEGKMLALSARNWAEEHNAKELLSYAMSVDGYLSLTLSATDDALATFQQGYTLSQSNDTLLQPGDFASMIALVYEYRHEPELALPYFQEAYDYYQANDIKLELANTIFGLGKANLDLGNRDTGLAQLKRSAELALEIGDLQGAAYSYQVMAQQLIDEGKLSSAEAFLTDALTIFEDADNRFMQINVLLSLNAIASQQSQFAYSLTLLDEAQALAEGEAFLPSKIAINERKAQLFATMDEFEKAYQLMLINTALKNRLNQEQNSQRLLELKTRFEVEQQEAQNALLREQNLRQQALLLNEQKLQRYIFAVVVLLLIICLLLAFLYIGGKRHQERLERLANEDELTGLMTRRKVLAQFEHHLQLAQRHDTPLTLALLDLDYFKKINDEHGHQTGDAVLKAFGELARNTFRRTDMLGRIGGEEFLFFFPHTDLSEAQTLLKRFSVACRDIPFTIDKPELNVSVSAGVTMLSDNQSAKVLMAQADEALYQAKSEGRDRLVCAP